MNLTLVFDLDCDYLTDTHLSEVFSNKNNGWEADAVAPCLLKRVVGESCDGWGGWMRGDCGEHWRLQLTVDTGPGEQSQPDHQLSLEMKIVKMMVMMLQKLWKKQ